MRVIVIGAGLAGLFTASELVGAGIDEVLVVDKESEPGGVTRTIRREGYSLEPGAGTLMLPHPHLTPVLKRFGGKVVAADPAATLRYVYTGGRLVALPSSPKALLAPLVPISAKIRAALEPLVHTHARSEDESLDVFFRRRLGDKLGGSLSWIAASGVYAGDPARLSARSAFPLFPALEKEAGSILRGGLRRLRNREPGASRPTVHLPVDGMAEMVGSVASVLGDRFRGGFHVDSVVRHGSGWRLEGSETIFADHVVLALPPHAAALLADSDLGDVLARAVTAPVVVVGLGGPSDALPLPAGFGVLTGPDSGTVSLGVLFESSYAPQRAPQGHSLVKVIAGGARRPEVVDWDDARIIETVTSEVSQILGTDISPSFVEIVRHRAGIPQYEIGHGEWLAELDGSLGDRPGLHLTGWGYRGVGVAHLASDAMATAARIASAG